MFEVLYRTTRLSPARLFIWGLLLLGVVAVLDYLTGYEIRLYVFYFPSVAIVSWSGKRLLALCIVVLSTSILFIQQAVSVLPYSHPLYAYWSIFTGGVAFSFIAVLSLVTRAMFDRAQARTEELARANSKLEQYARELSAVMDAAPAAIFVAEDPDCQRITGNARAHELLDVPRTANLSASAPAPHPRRRYRVLKGGRELPVSERPMQLAAGGESQIDYTFELLYDDGTLTSLRGDAIPLRDSAGVPQGAVGAFLDITDRRRLEEELEQATARFKAAMANAQDAICIFDARGNLTDISESCRTFMRASSSDPTPRTFEQYLKIMELYTPDGEMVPEENWVLPRALRGETGSNVEYEIKLKNTGETWPATFSFSPFRDGEGAITGGIMIARDTTELKRLAQETRDLEHRKMSAQRLECLGLVAGGIAHTLNNQLQAILSGCEIVSTAFPTESKYSCTLETVWGAADRATTIVRNMLEYSGHAYCSWELISLESILGKVLDKFKATAAENIKVHSGNVGKELPVKLDKIQLEQLLLNLLTNAKEAIGDRIGVIDLSIGYVDSEQEGLARLRSKLFPDITEPLSSGRYVCLKVADTGVGMDAETIRRMFDPFFTTKGFGRGLGLATVLGVVRGHHGVMSVRSTPGKGSEISVYFPTEDSRARAERAGACAERQ